MLTALLLSFSLAAPGDAIYIMAGQKVVLTTPQKLGPLANAVASTFPGIPPASLDRYYCFANTPAVKNRKAIDLTAYAASSPWRCLAIDGNPTTTDEAAFDYELDSGGVCKIVDRPDGNTFLRCGREEMGFDARLLNDALTQAVFGKPLDRNWDYVCDRDPAVDGKITCANAWIKIASIAIWRVDRKAGKVVGSPIGKVKPAS